ncbi:MAG TPA: tetratricopeptide repeat protein, partial [Pyrinomonadaceae bacterium]
QNISYLFSTTFHSRELSFEIGSGRGYRQFLRAVLPLIPENCLDVRSIELRDHFKAKSEVAARARELQIPGSDVLDALSILAKPERNSGTSWQTGDAAERAGELRDVANELRTVGRLVQALEAFRRALRLAPANGRLIYEFARCLHSLAASKRDPWLERKSQALLRLAERHSDGDTDLLSRIGETYFSIGAWSGAERAFKKAVGSENAGYRIFRGLGELALKDGKIAHAINYFARSAEFARPRSLSRWAQAEADYLRRINDDEEYMEVEIGRINLYDNFSAASRTAFKVFFFGLLVIPLGLLLASSLIADIGWAVSGVSMLIAIGASVMKSVFSSRIPFDMLDK